MSLTLVVWLLTVAVLSGLTLQRAAYGVTLYLFTYFISPTFWEWGNPIETFRWNLYAALVLLLGVFLQGTRVSESESRQDTLTTAVGIIAILMVVNATGVHLAFAAKPQVSITLFVLMIKFVILYFVIVAAIRTPADLRLVVWSIILCATYIGFQATVNDAGNITGGRLERIGAAGVQNSNELASLLLAVVPLGGYLFLTGTRREKILAALTTPLSLNVILLCNSRGAFLGLIAAAIMIVAMAPKAVRRKVLKGLALGSVALVLLLRDPDILDRFLTVFVDQEEMDKSADARFVIWSAALRQIRDFPLGEGGESFSHVYGRKYLPSVGGVAAGRAVHNGYLNEATNWGIQGLLLRLMFYGFGFLAAYRMIRRCARAGDSDGALLAICLNSAIVGVLISAVFGDYLDDDWGIWLIALMVAHARVYSADPATVRAEGRSLSFPSGQLPATVSMRGSAQ
jgi:putative inorganic carbon (HCO3(-)) transporter